MALQENENSDELLFIQTSLVAVTIKGSAVHPAVPGIEVTEKEAELRVACDDEYDLSLAGAPEETEKCQLEHAHLGTYKLRPLFFEQQRYEIVIEPEAGHTASFWHENYNVRKNVTPVGRKGSMLSGVINFGNEIGFADLLIQVDGKQYLKLIIEVFPSKISYKQDYKAIVADVTTEVYNLVFDFLKKTYESFNIDSRQQSSPVEFFAIIRKIYGEFMAAADMVLVKPHHLLEKEHQVLPSHRVKRTDNRSLRWIEKHPELTKRTKQGMVVAKALAAQKHVTFDTQENRLTKYMLCSTARRLEQFSDKYLRLARDADDAIVKEISRMVNGIMHRTNKGFMKEVTAVPATWGMSLVFNMAPGYRELYRCYLLLQHGLSVTGNVFNISVKELAVLYEYWCFIKLNSIMKERYELLSQDVIKVSGNGLFVSLIKGQRSRVRYLNPDNGEIITLSYNPKELNGPTVAQRPDNVLRLEKKGAKINYAYVFDAKYRINAAAEGSMYQKAYSTPGPQEDDINTMHRYRDAIVYSSGASHFEQTMFGAYVLFPYHNEQEYSKHHFFQSIEKVNIGGLPFLPSATGMVERMLDELITDTPESAFERATLPTGIEERLKKVDWSQHEVLIGNVKSQEQMKLCLEQKYYYTYQDQIAKSNLPIYYVALYQPGLGIEYYGKVLITQLVWRHSIPGKASRPDEACYKFYVDEWIKLKNIIRPQSYGPGSVKYTNMFLLKNSNLYPELHLQNEAEYRFYTELKRRSKKLEMSELTDDKTGFELDGVKVLFENGEIQAIVDRQVVATCKVKDFLAKPNVSFRAMQGRLERAKGVKDRNSAMSPGRFY